ncbi:hypothetical protein HAX54_044658 [Datura stramonium]|uniref:Uncharacterized protein n=1 Tax=Datura stramonium TaxID=4076 RepID=A0ABS8WJP8_DATST|nr:hypothetical protein [Datura stramonium]
MFKMEVEDDLFFADLSKQISLLIMDDDEHEHEHEHEHENSSPYRPSPHSLQGFSQVMHPATRAPYVYEQNSRREIISKGTGVFIPLSSHPRRKNRQPRHFSSNTKIQGQTERQLINQVPPYNYNSLNPTRFS